MIGRFAPSPTGELHLGNLRTALVAWLSARSQDGTFLVRMEDLDRANSAAHLADAQLDALRWLGLDWDGPVMFQSRRFDRYEAAIESLRNRGLTYPCYCSRREIAAAVAAPHGDTDQPYPGTCRHLTMLERAERERSGRRPALRLAAPRHVGTFADGLHGRFTGWIDDVILRRNDGVPAYNLAVVVDDAAQGVTEVVRGDDLLTSTPRQILIAELLGLSQRRYIHVPLVLGPDGSRLAKRHGAVTAAAVRSRGFRAEQVVGTLAHSLGLTESAAPVAAGELVDSFELARLRRAPWVFDDEAVSRDAKL